MNSDVRYIAVDGQQASAICARKYGEHESCTKVEQ